MEVIKMMQLRNILIPLELTTHSLQTLKVACDIASKYNAKINILHVFEPSLNPWVLEKDKEKTLKKLEMICKPYGVSMNNSHFCIGSVKHEILRLAELLNIDLIVIGHHGGKHLAPLMKSVAEVLISKAPCNVLTIVQNTETVRIRNSKERQLCVA
jgi:universal stress protein A